MQSADLMEREVLKLRSLNHSQSDALFQYSATPSLIQWDTSSFWYWKQSTSEVATIKFFIRKQAAQLQTETFSSWNRFGKLWCKKE